MPPSIFTKFVRDPSLHRDRESVELPQVVVIYGWVGSSMKYVRKYADLLLEIGVDEVWCTIASRSEVFLRNAAALPAIAKKTLAELQAHAAGKHAAVMSFSNGGAMVYGYLWKQIASDMALPKAQRRYPDVHMVASIFDSAPAYLSMHTGSRAMADSLPSRWQRILVYILSRLLLPILVLTFYPGGLNASTVYFESLLSDTLALPQLYIYSETDTTTDHQKLSDFIAARKRRHPNGADAVRSLYVPAADGPSPHCGHYRAHPQRYRSELRDFLRRAMQNAGSK